MAWSSERHVLSEVKVRGRGWRRLRPGDICRLRQVSALIMQQLHKALASSMRRPFMQQLHKALASSMRRPFLR